VKTFVDVGASLGQYTLLASRCIKGGTIYAIEADPVRFEELERNCVRWAGESGNEIVPLHAAAADREGPVTFYVTDSPVSGGLSRREQAGAGPSWREVTVQAATLDGLMAGRSPDFVKMDVEGGELCALRGARSILEAGRTLFLVEIHSWGGGGGQQGPKEVRQFMASFGYRAVPFHGPTLFVKEMAAAPGPVWWVRLRGLVRSVLSRLAPDCVRRWRADRG
jgi:FkbM family methyltransferase